MWPTVIRNLPLIQRAGAASILAMLTASCASYASERRDYDDAQNYPAGDYSNGYANLDYPTSANHQNRSGIDAAREAHRRYSNSRAEQLDGNCESRVTLEYGETLSDLAEFCDVSIAGIMNVNRGIRNANYVSVGEHIYIPNRQANVYGDGRRDYDYSDIRHQQNYAPEHALERDGVRDYYVVRNGDTLAEIAQRYNVSLKDIAHLNPNLRSRDLGIGSRVYLPSYAHAPGSGNEPWRRDISYRSESSFDESHADRPANPRISNRRSDGDRVAPSNSTARLTAVDQDVYRDDKVTLTAQGFPANTPVSIYGGPDRNSLVKIAEARTGPRGVFDTEVEIPETVNGDSIVFVAAVEDGARTYFTERVRIRTDNGGYGDRDYVRSSAAISPSAYRIDTVATRIPTVLDRGSERNGGSIFSRFGKEDLRHEVGINSGGQSAISGVLTNEGKNCPTLRDDAGSLYSLLGDLKGFDDGDRVLISGSARADDRICAQAETIQVFAIKKAPW